jgi:hypothetical protein
MTKQFKAKLKENVNCKLIENKEHRIDIVLTLTKRQMTRLLLEKGKQPKTLYSRIIIEETEY